MAPFTAYQTREALEVMLSYLLPGALAVMLYPWLAAAATQLWGFESWPQVPDEPSLKILLAVLIGPLLRGMDNILYPLFLNYNVLNHALWIQYRKLRRKYLDLLAGRRKYSVFANVSETKIRIMERCESLADGFMWSSAVLFVGSVAKLICLQWFVGIGALVFSWVLLESGLHHLEELVTLIEEELA